MPQLSLVGYVLEDKAPVNHVLLVLSTSLHISSANDNVNVGAEKYGCATVKPQYFWETKRPQKQGQIA